MTTETLTAAAQFETAPAADMRGLLAPGRRESYALAGVATLTVRSRATGNRFTFKLTQSDPRPGQSPVFFVGVLHSEGRGYRYLGTVFPDGFRLTKKSAVRADEPAAVAFGWLATHWEDERVEVWHEGVCGRCGLKLTDPASIETGIGPTCAKKLAQAA